MEKIHIKIVKFGVENFKLKINIQILELIKVNCNGVNFKKKYQTFVILKIRKNYNTEGNN